MGELGLVLGIDVSTRAPKGVLVGGSGAVRGIGTAEYAYDTPRALWSEQDPGLWWAGSVEAIGRALVAAGVAGEAVEAVGLTGQMDGAGLLDTGGAGLRPRTLWDDQPTAVEGDEMRALVGPDRLIEITGNDAITGFTAPKLLWIRR